MEPDQPQGWQVRTQRELGRGRVCAFIEDEIVTPSGETITRQYTTHPGAVAIVAWDEHNDTIMCVRQYRHPVQMELVEIPAGLLDVESEDYLDAAKRELAEEAEVAAAQWEVLVDMATSPGASQEALRIYLARELSPTVRPEGFTLEGEEAHMSAAPVPREELVQWIFDGHCASPTLVAGVLALEVARCNQRKLRRPSAGWLLRDGSDPGESC